MSDPIVRLNVALQGRYRVERELGEGGMATVYLADDLKHERKVAEQLDLGESSHGYCRTKRKRGSGDRITDVLSVVTEAQRAREKSREHIPIHRLRIGAVYAVAERELRRGGRFKDMRSAKNTIDDALARRLGVRGLGGFDSLLDDWFRYGSKELERAALQRCLSEDQRARVGAVFRRGPGKYAIESDGRLWVLRRFDRYGTLASGASVVSVREQAFARLRGFAPCSFRVIGKIPEEWQLESEQGEWEQVEPGAGSPTAPSDSAMRSGARGAKPTGTRLTHRFSRGRGLAR